MSCSLYLFTERSKVAKAAWLSLMKRPPTSMVGAIPKREGFGADPFATPLSDGD
jgi:hypothetical protein